MFSNTASTVDSAAKVMNRKNNAPHTLPWVMLLNTLGRVTKIRLGPESTSTLYVKQAGKIMRPETMATKVSSSATLTDSPSKVRSFPM